MARSRPTASTDLKSTRKGKVRRRSVFWRMRRSLFLAALVMTVAFGGAGYVVSKVELPKAPLANQTSFICAADVSQGCNASNAMAKLHGSQDRVEVKLSQVPPDLEHAVLAVEDREFFKHGGVDPVGITRAAVADIRGSSSQGGSTITQQYVKNVYLTQERTLSRKLKEAVLSVKLEQKMSKAQILEAYLNTIYFGRGAYGVQAASRVYFAKDVEQISLDQAAYLAGLIQGPGSADFQTNAVEARRRRALALAAMVHEHYITEGQRVFAEAVPFTAPGYQIFEARKQVDVLRGHEVGSDYFVEYVRRYLVKRYGEASVYRGGLRVYTTLDLGQQQAAYKAVTSVLDKPGDPSGSLVAVDDQGRIKAMMGGTDFGQQQVNLAVGRDGGGSGRQPGSTFKAFALAEAIHEGYTVKSTFTSPDQIILPKADAGKDWTVKGGCCGGTTDLVTATQDSINTVYAQLMLKLGPQNVANMANRLGVKASFKDPQPSLVLGSGDVSVLDMAAAYSTLADKGTRVDPITITRVEDANGNQLPLESQARTSVLTEGENAKVVYALQQVVLNGSGTAAQIDKPVAGKTGTTDNNHDAWFVGFTPKVTAAVWMGYPGFDGVPPGPMTDVHGETVSGGNLPARIWAAFMRDVTANDPPLDFPGAGDLTDGKEFNPQLIVPSTAISVPTPTAPTSTTTTSPPTTAAPSTEAHSTTTAVSDTTPSSAPDTTAAAPPASTAGPGP